MIVDAGRRQWIRDEAAGGRFLVDRTAFTDPAVLELERQSVFAHCWLYVGHESEVPEPGDFVTRSVGMRPIILIRDLAGELRVLFNACTHEGSLVCRVARGQARALQCFFHGWTFDTRGELVGIPGSDGYGGSFDPADYGLRRPGKVDSYRGFVFMNPDAQAPDLPEYLGRACEFLDLVVEESDGGMEVVPGSHRYSTQANWKLLAMNSIDGYHVVTAHATYLEYLRDMGIDTSGGWKVGRRYDLGRGHIAAEFYAKWARPVARWCSQFPESVRPRIEARRAELGRRHGEERAHRIADVDRNLFVFPNLVVNDHSAVLIRTFDPLASDRLEVSTWALAPVDEDPDLRALRLANYVTFWGPAGFATPDDVEALETAQRAICAEGGGFTDVSKGAQRERDADRQSNTDELQLRAFWRAWQGWMDTCPQGGQA